MKYLAIVQCSLRSTLFGNGQFVTIYVRQCSDCVLLITRS